MPGAPDAEGVYQYAEDDVETQMSDLLNLGMDSVSQQLALDRARLNALEPEGWVYPTLAKGTNVSGNAFGYRKSGGQLQLRGRVGSLSANDVMFTFPFALDSGADNVIRLDTGASTESRVNFKSNGEIEVLSWGGGSITFTGVVLPVAP